MTSHYITNRFNALATMIMFEIGNNTNLLQSNYHITWIKRFYFLQIMKKELKQFGTRFRTGGGDWQHIIIFSGFPDKV